MASEMKQFCGNLDRSIVFGDGNNLYVLINQGSGINSVAKLSTCDGLTDECESRLVAMARLLIDASTAIDTTGKNPSELAGEVERLTTERDQAIKMLADWCEAIDHNGTGWDDWDEHYKDAAYRPGPLRELLDTAIATAKEQRSSRFA